MTDREANRIVKKLPARQRGAVAKARAAGVRAEDRGDDSEAHRAMDKEEPMISPNSQDDLHYVRIAFYATRCLRVWLWPNHLSRRVVLAAMLADSPREAAVAAVEEATRIIKEGGDHIEGDDARPVNPVVLPV